MRVGVLRPGIVERTEAAIGVGEARGIIEVVIARDLSVVVDPLSVGLAVEAGIIVGGERAILENEAVGLGALVVQVQSRDGAGIVNAHGQRGRGARIVDAGVVGAVPVVAVVASLIVHP